MSITAQCSQFAHQDPEDVFCPLLQRHWLELSSSEMWQAIHCHYEDPTAVSRKRDTAPGAMTNCTVLAAKIINRGVATKKKCGKALWEQEYDYLLLET